MFQSDTHKVVMCKIPREEFTRFQQYCDMNDETSNSCLKRIISENIDNPQPAKIAGKSVFEYNKQKDNFSWKVLLDDNSSFSIDGNLPAETIEQLLLQLEQTNINYRLEWYPGAEHGFAFPGRGDIYHKASAERHWERLHALFDRNLSH